jgi:hypothetical protein
MPTLRRPRQGIRTAKKFMVAQDQTQKKHPNTAGLRMLYATN